MEIMNGTQERERDREKPPSYMAPATFMGWSFFPAFKHRSAIWKYSVAGVFPNDVVLHALFSAHYRWRQC